MIFMIFKLSDLKPTPGKRKKKKRKKTILGKIPKDPENL